MHVNMCMQLFGYFFKYSIAFHLAGTLTVISAVLRSTAGSAPVFEFICPDLAFYCGLLFKVFHNNDSFLNMDNTDILIYFVSYVNALTNSIYNSFCFD